MNLAESIRAARGSESREAFAGRIGCSLASVIRWESGSAPRSSAHILNLAKAGVNHPLIKQQRPVQDAPVAAGRRCERCKDHLDDTTCSGLEHRDLCKWCDDFIQGIERDAREEAAQEAHADDIEGAA